MNQVIDIYCERMSAAFWAEPINAITNGAFLIAALVLAVQMRGRADRALWVLIGLITAIGIGSFLFHTFATRWAALTDVIPILLFMLCAVAIGLRRRFGLPAFAVAGGTLAFLLSGALVGVTPLAEWLPRGSASYAPALATLGLFALFLALRRDPFAPLFAAATLVFAVSLTLRTIDMPLCEAIPMGTHFGWHVLNAVTLYLVTRGLVRAQR